MRRVSLGLIVVGTLASLGLPAASAQPAPSGATASGTLTYEGRTHKLTHVTCASTSWPLVRMVFTTTPLPQELMANETAKHDYLAKKGAPRIDLAVKFREEEAPLYLMAGITDPASKVNPGSESILEDPPPYTFTKKVLDDTRVAGSVATPRPVKTSANQLAYSFDVAFDVRKAACQ